jgi:succinate-semialdehyde dehydrogenase/glutarate-semialdehyde dehydrogenase
MKLKDPSLLRQQCFVGGAWTGTPATPVTNPANGAEIAKVPFFGAAETRDAIAKANAAFPAWARMTGKKRAGLMRAWFELIMANREDIALIMTTEQGKPLAEALGEVDYAASFVEFNGEEAKRIYGETSQSHREDARIVVIKQPIGVVGAITPWNFPAAMITRKCAPALAAGCTVVCKPAGETPLTALALAVLAERAGIPAGVFNVITGKASAIGGELTSSPIVRCIAFTGSTEVGKLLMQQAASTVKKVALELGGNSPFIVFDYAVIV